ncbi:MAG: glycoside hydrolase family 88 protein [Bacteroidales bacterium]|nr:glycoside hydrolase family 88 protein [Bacteroidales bacterium]
MKTSLIFLNSCILLFIYSNSILAQSISQDELIIRKIADRILRETNYEIMDKETGKCFVNSEGLNSNKPYVINNQYLAWEYWNGVTNLAMVRLAEVTGDSQYLDYAKANYSFVFDNISFFEALKENGYSETGLQKYSRFQMLDDCGSLAAGLVDVYLEDARTDYLKYIDRVADYILNKEHRLEDGTLARTGPFDKTIWLDDLYMSLPFVVRYGKLTGDSTYFDLAAQQIINYHKYLYDETTGIYFHCYFEPMQENGVARWGRANGWAILALAQVLDYLPENHPQRVDLLTIYKQHIIGLSRYQSASGLWHQLIDKPDSYLETSSSAMFTYAIAKGVNKGWLDPYFSSLALSAWEGLKTTIQDDGQVQGICVGTWIQSDIGFYYNRPVQVNDIHGIGAVILAGSEVLKLKQ